MSNLPPPETRGSLGASFKRLVRSLLLPSDASPDQAAIVIGSDLPTCMQTPYSSAIFWRPRFSVSGTAPYFFMAQVRSVAVDSQRVDSGYVWFDGTNCEYVVTQRRSAVNTPGGSFETTEQFGRVFKTAGATWVSGNPLINYFDAELNFGLSTLIQVFTPTEFRLFGDYFSLRQHANSGLCNATTAINTTGVFSNYPTAVTNTITKVGSAAQTNLVVHYSQTFFVSVADTGPQFGVNIGGTDFITHKVAPAIPVNSRFGSYGIARCAGLAAGAYTVTPRWMRVAGSGNVQGVINDDWTSLETREVPV